MTATNHALTGAIIGLTIAGPWALALAFFSHFVLDSIPHYSDQKLEYAPKKFAVLLSMQALSCLLLVVFLGIVHTENWILPSVCAFLATAPDFMWAPKFFRSLKNKNKNKVTGTNLILKFHGKIQWFERPIGIVVEVFWAIGAISILAILI